MRLTPTVSIVAPCYNEESNIDPLIKRIANAMNETNSEFEIVLVDDGSTDSTWEQLNVCKKKYSFLKIIRLEKNSGIPEAWIHGVENSNGEYVCLIDADLQNLPEDVPRLLHTILNSEVSFVQGCRVPENNDWIRVAYSKSLNFLLNLIFWDNAKDNKSGFLIGKKNDLYKALSHRYKYFHFQTFIRASAKSHGFNFVEIPTKFNNRHSGESFIKGKKAAIIPIQVLLDLPKAIVEFRIRKR